MNHTIAPLLNRVGNISVGDIITAYHKGYHVVDKIEESKYSISQSPNSIRITYIVHYTKVANENGKKSRKIKNRCNIDFCKRLTHKLVRDMYNMEIQGANDKRDNLSKLLTEKDN